MENKRIKKKYDQKDVNYEIKIALIGPFNAGKSSVLKRYTNNFFEKNSMKPTISVDIVTKIIEIKGNKTCKIEMWDTAGTEKASKLIKSSFQRTHGFMLIYDLTDSSSFEESQYWLSEIEKNGHPHAPILLVGNKSDAIEKREVNIDNINQFISTKRFLSHMETSASSGKNIKESFDFLIENIVKKIESNEINFLIDSKMLEDFNMKNKSSNKFICC